MSKVILDAVLTQLEQTIYDWTREATTDGRAMLSRKGLSLLDQVIDCIEVKCTRYPFEKAREHLRVLSDGDSNQAEAEMEYYAAWCIRNLDEGISLCKAG